MAPITNYNLYRTVPALIEFLQREANAGIDTIDSRYNPLFLQQMIVAGRAELIKSAYTGNRGMAENHFIPDIAKQTYELEYDPLLNQNNKECWVKFFCPDVISLDSESDGFRRIGNERGGKAYIRIKSDEQFDQYNDDAMMKKIMDTKVLWWYVADERVMKVRDIAPEYKAIRHGKVRAIFSNFIENPQFNFDVDFIPLDGNSLITLINSLWSVIRLSAYAKPDEVADGSDNSSQANLTRYLFGQFIKGSENVPV